ncbi:MAG TPA: carboxypeptidase regulatory-like domain-containing protein [Gemmatimonadaceae bacterium]|nr:carboxypeptidase regulatory-like domain-containing protein [Gemmatimonadaceae bacterium]
MVRLHAVSAVSIAIVFAACARSSATDQLDVAPQPGSVTVKGRVVDSNGNPVRDARVYIPTAGDVTRTDANGNYMLTGVPDGPQTVVVRKRGFAPTRVAAKFSTKPSDRERNTVNVTLLTQPEAVNLANMQSRDSSALARVGFLQREGRTRGAYFLTPEDIAATRAVTTSDLFRQVPVLVEVPGRTGGNVLRGANGCLTTYVDGVRWRSMFPGDLDTYIPVNDVVAAEVYPPGQLPPPPFNQSGNRLNCTTLGIWTRSAVG